MEDFQEYPPVLNEQQIDEKLLALRNKMKIIEDLESGDAVAGYFRKEGIKGIIGGAKQCPIARWLKADEALVNGYEISVYPGSVTLYTEPYSISVNCKSPVWQFIESFDRGYYRDLIDGPVPQTINYDDDAEPDEAGKLLNDEL